MRASASCASGTPLSAREISRAIAAGSPALTRSISASDGVIRSNSRLINMRVHLAENGTIIDHAPSLEIGAWNGIRLYNLDQCPQSEHLEELAFDLAAKQLGIAALERRGVGFNP